jgi:hypothetical protein
MNKEKLCGKDEYITDFLGIRHGIEFFPASYEHNSGAVFQKLPIPDDGFHAESIEYVACFTSVEDSSDSYTMFELGAGWGPWMSIAGSTAIKKGIKKINLIGVEGAHNKTGFIKKHLLENGLRPDKEDLETTLYNPQFQWEVNTKIYDGIINATGDDMEFPEVPPDAYGASLTDGTSARMDTRLIKTKGYSFSGISSGYDLIDFVHLDLQGYEEEFVPSVIETLKEKVRFLFIGTHTRRIEGNLLNVLYDNGFKLLREQPCRVAWPESKPASFVDCTFKDGGQFWVNKNLPGKT